MPTLPTYEARVVVGNLNGTEAALPQPAPTAMRIREVKVHPKAYYDVSSCGPSTFTAPVTLPTDAECDTDQLLCQKTLFCLTVENNVQNAATKGLNLEYDIAVLLLEDNPPADIHLLPVLLDSATSLTDVVNAARVPTSVFDSWILDPRNADGSPAPPRDVLMVGYGTGSVGRDVGVTTLLSTTAEFTRWTGCSTTVTNTMARRLNSTAEGAVAALDARFQAGLPTVLAPGQSLAGMGVNEVWSAPGDSGGPMLAGSYEGPHGFTLSALPSNPSIDTSKLYVIGVDSTGYYGSSGHVPTVHPEISPWLANLLRDSDGDGVPSSADNCPYDTNADQLDSDHDGTGDACDPCPCDSQPLTGVPRDTDGVCDYCNTGLSPECAAYCPTHPLDNCAGVSNPDQANCNADAERKVGARVMGDACDPVPCPQFVPNPTVSTTISVDSDYDPSTGGVSTTKVVNVRNDQLSFNLLGSHGAPDLADPTRRGVNEVVTGGYIKHRYCTTLPSQSIDCDDPAWVANDSIVDQTENGLSGWHRVKMAHLTSFNDVDTNRTYGGTAAQSRFSLTWQWSADFQRWATSWGTIFGGLATIDQIDEGKGRFWAHFSTPLGTTNTSLNTGLHGQATNITVTAQPLMANHYQSFAPLEQKTWTTTFKMPLFEVPAFITPCAPVGCPADLGIYSLDECPMCALKPGDAFDIYDSMPLGFYDPLTSQPFGAVAANGTYVPLKDNFSPALQTLLTQGVKVVGAVEPSPSVGSSSSYPQMLALSADGTQVVDRITMLRKGMFTTAADRSEPALPSSPSSPTARSAFASVYARSTGRVFVVGGKNASSAPLGDIWTRSLSSSWVQWQPVLFGTSTPYTVGEVLAATHSFRDNCVYVLDVPTGTSQVRLVRISSRQRVQVIGTWTRTTTATRQWLTIDRNGEVLLSVARDATAQTRVFRLDNPTSVDSGVVPTVAGSLTLSTAVKFKPIADGRAYWFLGENASDQTPDARRPERLVLTSATWADVGAAF